MSLGGKQGLKKEGDVKLDISVSTKCDQTMLLSSCRDASIVFIQDRSTFGALRNSAKTEAIKKLEMN